MGDPDNKYGARDVNGKRLVSEKRAPWPDTWKPPCGDPLWVYLREDGCELELYARTETHAIAVLKEFGVVNFDKAKLKLREKENVERDRAEWK